MPLPITVPDISNEELFPTSPKSKGGFVNRLDQFGYGIENAFDKTGSVFDPLKWAMEYYNPGPLVDNKELPTDLQNEYPNGVGQNVLNLIQDQKQHDNFVNQQLSYAPQGALTDISQFGAGVIGTMLAPQNALIGAVAPEALPERILADTAMSTKAANFVAHGIKGAAVGEEVNTFANLNNYYYDKQLGNNPQVGEIFNNWVLAGAIPFLGGGIHGLIKSSRAGSPVADADLLNTAVKQANADKPVDVTLQAQQARYEQAQKMRDENFDIDTSRALSSELGNRIDDINNQINKENDIPDVSDTIGSGVLNKLNENLYDSSNINENDQRFNRNTQDLWYMNDLGKLSSKNPSFRTTDEQTQLDNFYNNPSIENDLIDQFEQDNNKRIENTQNKINQIQNDSKPLAKKISKINEQMAQTEDQDKLSDLGQKRQELQNEIDEIRKHLDDHKTNAKNYKNASKLIVKRRAELNNLSKQPKQLINKAIEREKLKSERMNFQSIKDRQDALINIYDTPPVDKESILRTRDHMNSTKTDIGYDSEDDTRMDQQIPGGFPDRLDDVKNKAIELMNKGLIDKDEFNKIEDEHRNDRQKINQINKTMNDYIRCRTGG